jgi:hypothetical protein
MALYIWLLWHQVVVFCQSGVGCMSTSMAHFNYLIGVGALELIFELAGIIKIFTKNGTPKDKKEE